MEGLCQNAGSSTDIPPEVQAEEAAPDVSLDVQAEEAALNGEAGTVSATDVDLVPATFFKQGVKRPGWRVVQEHNVTHLPYAPWCDVCVKARAVDDAHRRVTLHRHLRGIGDSQGGI